MKYIKNKKIILLIISVVFISFFSKIVFAAWNGLPYSPGTIDNPECLPSQINCDVLPSLTNESDPIFIASQAFNISGVDISDWDTAYGWGNHTLQGYITGTPWTTVGYITDGNTDWDNSYGFITSYTETDPLFISSQSYNITIADITNLSNLSGINTGDENNSSIKTKLGKATNSDDGYLSSTDWTTFNNKQTAGSYLTSYTETDPVFTTSPASSLSLSDLTDIGNLSGLNTGDQNLSGLIPYSGATSSVDLGSNNLTVDTNTFFVDSANNKVGVGTTTPTYKFEVKGSAATDSIRTWTGLDFYSVTAPVAPTGTLSTGGAITPGLHYWHVSYITALGETNTVSTFSLTTDSTNNAVDLIIPVSTDPRVTGRRIYRTKANQTSDAGYFLAAINDNTTTTYKDIIADTSLTGNWGMRYRVNSTALGVTKDGARTMFWDENLTSFGLSAGNNLGQTGYAPIRTTLFGHRAGYAITTGTSNHIFGFTGQGITTGSSNHLFGDLAGYAINTGSSNHLFGEQAGRYVSTGGGNNFFGQSTGPKIITGGYNVQIGYNVGNNSAAIDSSYSTALGSYSYNTKSNQTVIGADKSYAAGASNDETIINGDTFIKKEASLGAENLTNGALTSGTSWAANNDCSLVSDKATCTYSGGLASTLTQTQGNLIYNITGSRWYKFVYTVSGVTGTPTATIPTTTSMVATNLYVSANGTYTVYFQAAAAPTNFVISSTLTTGQAFAVDSLSLKEVIGGDLNVNGNLNLSNTTRNSEGIIYKGGNRFIHDFSYGLNGGGITPTGNNLFIGKNSGNFTMGSTATSAGYSSNNLGIGTESLYNNTTGYVNVAIGYQSLYFNNVGNSNTAIGYGTLRANLGGASNVAIGREALYSTTNSSYSIGIGEAAGSKISGGSSNVTSAANSIFIGYNTRALADTQTNQIVIGDQATGIGSNSVVLGNDSIITTVLKGNVGVGTTAPVSKFQVHNVSTYGFLLSDDLVGTTNNAYFSVRKYSTGNGGAWIQGYSDSDTPGFSFEGFNGSTNPTMPGIAFAGSKVGGPFGSTEKVFTFGNGSLGAETNIMTMLGNGNVGIGTTLPLVKLNVFGNTKIGMSTNIAANTLDISGNLNFDYLANPTSSEVGGISVVASPGGSLGAGTYRYDIIYVTADGETGSDQYSTMPSITTSANDRVVISNIPISSSPRVIARKIYRSKVNGGQYFTYYLTTLSNNTATTYTDTSSDASLGADYLYRKANTTAGQMNAGSNKVLQSSPYLTALGFGALQSNTSGNSIVAIGPSALNRNTTGTNSIGIGYNALFSNTTGGSNNAVGYASLFTNKTGEQNNAFGDGSLRSESLVSGYSYNSAFGYYALGGLLDNSNYNTAIGRFAGARNPWLGVAIGNTFIGARSGYMTLSSGSYNILLGYNADTPVDTISNFLNIGQVIYATGLGSGGSSPSLTGRVGIGTTTPGTKLEIGSSDLGDGLAGPIITLGRNTNATNAAAGSINFLDKSGLSGYVWQDAAGNMRINNSAPSTINDTAGIIIGSQTSTRDTKTEIVTYTDYAGALAMVTNAPLNTFRYIKEVEGYGTDSPLAKTRIGFIDDEVDPMFMSGNIIDQVSVNGLLMASIKELNLTLQDIANPIDDTNKSFIERFYEKMITWLGSPDNGLEKICVMKTDGSEFCVNGDQLEQAVNGLSNTTTTPAPVITTPDPVIDQTFDPIIEPTPDPIPEPDPVVTPDPTPIEPSEPEVITESDLITL